MISHENSKWVLWFYAQGKLVRAKQGLISSMSICCFGLWATLKWCHKEELIVWNLIHFHLGLEKNESGCDMSHVLDGPERCGR